MLKNFLNCIAIVCCIVTIHFHLSAEEVTILKASDGHAGDYFGYATAMTRDYAIVGNYPEIAGGEAYIFKRNADNSWTEDAILQSPTPEKFEEFGYSVGIDGNYAVVGSPGYDDSDGAVYVYKLENDSWTLQQTITQPSGSNVQNFGEFVKVNGSYILISTPYGSTRSDQGKAFLYKLTGDTWELAKTFSPPAGSPEDCGFGAWCDITANYIAISAPEAGSTEKGECYIYTNNSDSWDLTATITTPADIEEFGFTVSLTDTYLAVTGQAGEDLMTGKVFIYQNNAGSWTSTQTIQATASNNMFGYSIKFDDSLLAISDPLHSFQGRVYTYTLNAGTWELDQTITPPSHDGPGFGMSINLADNTYLIAGYPIANFEKGLAAIYAVDSSYITLAVSPNDSGSTSPAANTQHQVITNVPFDIEATALEGYVFSHWAINSGTVTITDSQSAKTTATVDGIGKITAHFVTTATVEFSVTPEDSGSTDPDETQTYIAGSTHTIRAVASEGYYFEKWVASGSIIINTPLLSQTTALVNGNGSIVASFKPFTQEVELTMNATPEAGGTTTPNKGTTIVESGQLFPITATPASGYHFLRWIIQGSGVITAPLSSSTTAAISANSTITAYFAENSAQAILTMTVNPENSGSTSPEVGETAINTNQPYQMEAYPADGYHFEYWTVSGAGSIDGHENTIAWITLSGDATVTANFAENTGQATLTMAVTPENSGSTNPGTGPHVVTTGEFIEIKATAASGYYFVSWLVSGSAVVIDPELAESYVELSGNATVTALFTTTPETVNLELKSTPTNGGHTNPGTGSHQVYKGSSLKIEALPEAGYYFINWSTVGESIIDEPYNSQTIIEVFDDTVATANFAPISDTATLTMKITPENSGFTNPGVGSHPVVVGQYYEIFALANDNYVFDYWYGEGSVQIKNPSDSFSLVVLSNNASITAVFKQKETDAHLILNVNPSNSGSTNPGIGIHTLAVGEATQVEAIAADGYYFAGWIGDGNVLISDTYAKETTIKLLRTASLTAAFSKKSSTAQLTLAVSPENSGTTNPGEGVHSVNVNEKIQVEAIPASGYHFVNWEISSGSATVNAEYQALTYVAIESDSVLIANFAVNETAVTVALASSPENGGFTSPATGSHTGLYKGQTISLKAYPANGYHFVSWQTESGANIDNKLAAQTTASLTANTTITANFATNDQQVSVIIINSDSNGGLVYPAPGSYNYYSGQSIKLEAAPLNNYNFIKWELDGEGVIDDDKSQIAYAVLEGNSTITAVFSTTLPAFLSYGSLLTANTDDLDEKRKRMYVTSYNTSNPEAQPRKLYFSNVIQDDDAKTLTGEWRHTVCLYNKKNYPNDTILSDILTLDPIQDLKCYGLYYDTRGKEATKLDMEVYLVNPIIDSVKGDYSEKGDIFVIEGRYFGSKLPSICLEYKVGEKVHYKKCKVDKKASLKYRNAKGVDNKSCMKILSSDPTDQQAVNYSQVSVKYPKLGAKAEPTGYIILKNNIGMTPFQLPGK